MIPLGTPQVVECAEDVGIDDYDDDGVGHKVNAVVESLWKSMEARIPMMPLGTLEIAQDEGIDDFDAEGVGHQVNGSSVSVEINEGEDFDDAVG